MSHPTAHTAIRIPRASAPRLALELFLLLIAARFPTLTAAELNPALLPPAATQRIDFSKEIRPLLETACLKCHGPEKPKSGFRIDSREHALAGGDNGPAIVPGDSAKSPLIHQVAGLLPEMLMPPKGKGEPLNPAQIGLLRAWIDQDLPWDGPANTTSSTNTTPRNKRDWWSLKPLSKPPVPQLPPTATIPANPVDAFVQATLRTNGLSPAPEADRRTLARRLFFDLTGLPPTPEEIARFLNDTHPRAYERLVERLLASPAYGERWARHWLDVVHYGETHGYDKDQPRPNAWPYRDYVIRSFNEDKPYTRFVQEQLAGDILYPGTRDGFEALGFIAAGPWDLIGHAEVPETKIDGKVARHLDRDDMVANTMQTFNSLTVQCAQCHNHKFDPITQEEYYSLQAVFAAVDRADKKYDIDPAVAAQRTSLNRKQSSLTAARREIEERIANRAGQALVNLDKQIAALPKPGKNPGDAFGYHSSITTTQALSKWVQVDLGQPHALTNVVLFACKDDFNGIGEGFGFPLRFKVELSNDPDFKTTVHLLADHSTQDLPNPRLTPVALGTSAVTSRYIRVTATRLAPRQNDFIFALAELQAFNTHGTNAAAGSTVTALDSIEAPVRWQKSNLTDGHFPGAAADAAATLATLQKQRASLLLHATLPDEQQSLARLEHDLDAIKQTLSKLPPESTVYIGAVHKGSGAFVGTGAQGGKPRPIHILSRGNVLKPGKPVSPGTLACLPGLPSRFELPPDHPEGARRAELARWITRPDNPLTWRSIVNRVWQYHFGRGLVETPNDFGRMGALPTHPELLDWLAAEFRDNGQSLKSLHRLIVSSATYRQASTATNPQATQVDSDNRLLWRQNRRKLEAEAIRDATLSVAGKLNLRAGGPSFRDFVIDKPEHSPHYEYHRHDPEDPGSHRRSIYRFIVRSQQQPFMTVLDCADPSMQVGKRNEGLSPLQALALLNNSLMLTMSKHFADRLEHLEGDLASRVRQGHLIAVGRSPDPAEFTALLAYARDHGLRNYCRLLLNLNEFAFVD